MNISLRTFFPAIALSAATLVSCSNDSDILSVARQYCVENNKTVEDYNNIENTEGRDKKMSKLDSIVYSDIFKTTKLVKDSSKVAEFNKIAAKNRSKFAYEVGYPFYDDVICSSLNKIAANNGMLLKDYEKMQEINDIAYRQNYIDNSVYKKFFRDNDVLDKNIEAKCNAYSKKISKSLNVEMENPQ